MGGHTFIGDEMETEKAQTFIDLVYHTSDGYVSIAIQQDKDWRGFARAVERTDLIDDDRFSSPQMREKNKDTRMEIIQNCVAEFSSTDILQRLEKEDVPCAPVLTRRDMRDNEQVVANEIVVETLHPDAGNLRQTRHPALFSQTPPEINRGAPQRGEHSIEVLAEAGFDDEAIQALENSEVIIQHRQSREQLS